MFAVRDDNPMRFDLQGFDQAVMNSSSEFDYYKNNTARLNTASQISGERQVRPVLNHTPADELVVVPFPGAVMLFSGTQLHSSIANRSGRARFGVDFRTVDVADLHAGRGAPLVDVDCTGTTIRDFEAFFDEGKVTRLFGAPPPGSTLVFTTDNGRGPCFIATRSRGLASMEYQRHTRRAVWYRTPA